MSNLSAIEYIQNLSAGTTGLWNQRYSVISANFAALNSELTLNLPSGDTFSLFTNLDASGNIHASGQMGIGPTPSAVTTGVMTIAASSAVSDYIHFEDTSGSRSDYLIGSRVGGTADGLNIYDLSGQTMIASFSKQSIRFFQNVVGPVFDVGGALADTYNAATFGNGAQSVETRIQAAINQAVIDGVSRVYIPANMYPYSASSVSFSKLVQMVREGGDWGNYDIVAYGADQKGLRDATSAIQSALNSVFSAGGGLVFSPVGSFAVSSTLTIKNAVSWVGSGASSVLSSTETYNHMVDIDAADAFGNRYGFVEKMALAGGSRTSVGVHCAGAVQRAFRDVSIQSFRDCGLAVNSAQNCLFERLDCENNGGTGTYSAGIRLNHGAGNNLFVNCEINQNGGCGVLFVQNDAADRATILAGFTAPAANRFMGCILERQVASSVTLVSLFSGRRNAFVECDFSNSSLSYTVDISADAGGSNIIDSCYFNGNASKSTAIRNAGFYTRIQNNFFENHIAGVETSQRLLLTPDNIFVSSGASVTNTSGNAVSNLRSVDAAGHFWLNQGRLISVRTAASLDSATLASDEMAFSFNASNASLAIYSGGTVWYFASSYSTRG